MSNNSVYLTHSSTMQEDENYVKEIKLMPETRMASLADTEGLDDRKFTVINRITDL